MARPRSPQPAYQYHVSGQAKVRLGYDDFYLGKHGSPESYARYYALLSEYNANGKVAPVRGKDVMRQAGDQILVKHVTADFRANVLPGYAENGQMTNRYTNLCLLLEKRLGETNAEEFGPRLLESLREVFLTKGIGEKGRANCRRQSNELTRNVIQIFRHGVARELIAPERLVALSALPPLKISAGQDNDAREEVPLDDVRATIPFLTATAAAMVRIQLATAMRPSELFRMTPAMIDRSGKVWVYKPTTHKTAHHDRKKKREKKVPILGEALKALTPYLFGDADEVCFLTTKGTPWNKDSYRIAVGRAAKAAKVKHWTPYQLRHAALQAVRDAKGPEAAQALAGHSRLATTELYASASEAKAIEAAKVAPRL
ncbi:site-specific tyrosine recombinase XerC [Rubripirellula lacrimiformis]|uniref:Site-specific tyrosine recombinase XerC n=1 Tax=Rubripirellula lacrimiformis TaxID=1930273 RepID=A0A517NIC4_9BACT|nr:tyrosine-type recombinase/integrase [Rubripirellula lacrimiformis]QDT06887.1 site-specific tyrosine recombinase XerC [Rubripirellula lacrimiformis]